jgi:hypothetical protein
LTGTCATCETVLDPARHARCAVCVGKMYCLECARSHFCMESCPLRGCKAGLCTREVIDCVDVSPR